MKKVFVFLLFRVGTTNILRGHRATSTKIIISVFVDSANYHFSLNVNSRINQFMRREWIPTVHFAFVKLAMKSRESEMKSMIYSGKSWECEKFLGASIYNFFWRFFRTVCWATGWVKGWASISTVLSFAWVFSRASAWAYGRAFLSFSLSFILASSCDYSSFLDFKKLLKI